MFSNELPSIDQVMQHGSDVMLLDEVIEHGDEKTIARAELSKKKWLQRDDGTTPSWVAVEYMAQCIAVHEGLRSHIHDRDLHTGFLISVRSLEVHVKEFASDSRLQIHTQPLRGRPGLGALSHQCAIYLEEEGAKGALLATGRLSIFIENVPAG